ncbi:MAG: translocation/assembly module TamB domain-containing protein, partial [Myxococcota bacterium]
AGDIQLVGGRPTAWDLKLVGNNLQARLQDSLIEAQANLFIRGESLVPKIEGEVVITRGRYRQKISLRDFVLVSEPTEISEPLGKSLPWLKDLNLDIHVIHGLPIEVAVDADLLQLNVELEADVTVRGTAARPQPQGRVSVIAGTLEFGSTALEIGEGSVDFISKNDKTSVLLNLRAESFVRADEERYWITVGLRGDSQAIELTLTSDPPLERLQILSLLFTGQTRVESLLGDENGSSSEARAAISVAASQLAKPLNDFVEKRLQNKLNVEFELKTQVTDNAVSIVVQKEVTPRLVLSGGYSYGFNGGASGSQAKATFLLSNTLFLQGNANIATGVTQTADDRELLTGQLELRLRLFGP